jgi:hypothetical protein
LGASCQEIIDPKSNVYRRNNGATPGGGLVSSEFPHAEPVEAANS